MTVCHNSNYHLKLLHATEKNKFPYRHNFYNKLIRSLTTVIFQSLAIYRWLLFYWSFLKAFITNCRQKSFIFKKFMERTLIKTLEYRYLVTKTTPLNLVSLSKLVGKLVGPFYFLDLFLAASGLQLRPAGSSPQRPGFPSQGPLLLWTPGSGRAGLSSCRSRLSSHGVWAQLPGTLWGLSPRPGREPASPHWKVATREVPWRALKTADLRLRKAGMN